MEFNELFGCLVVQVLKNTQQLISAGTLVVRVRGYL